MTSTIDDVIDRMRAIADSLPPRDGVGRFNAVYKQVSEEVRDRLTAGYFDDTAFVEHFDVVFAQRYFDAVDAAGAGQRVAHAWRPLFDRRADPRVHALQFAVAGMNAHINHDLPLAFIDTCEARDTHPTAGANPADYLKINQVIEDVETEVRRSLLSELEQELGEPLEPLMHLIDSWSVTRAREAAWVRVQVLWLLRNQRWLFEQSVAASDRAVGMTGRHLLTALLPARADEVA